MKTRIKEIKYGDGKIIYKVQYIQGFKSTFRNIGDDFRRNPLLIILLFPLLVILCSIMAYMWDESEYNSLSEAQEHIDEIYKEIKLEKEEKEKQKLAKKVVNKKYIKYP